MRAFWLLEPQGGGSVEGASIELSELAREGVYNARIEPGRHEEAIADVMQMRGYRTQDEVRLTPATEGLDGILARFDKEHHHTDDEVRYVLEGAGIFDIRSRDDRWMRIVVGPGDLIVVPRDRHHRFMLTETRTIRALRLFEDQAGWVPHYR
jgi:1,2-dihydroxy-3-keto-5-methylthiopentene dioxygenase